MINLKPAALIIKSFRLRHDQIDALNRIGLTTDGRPDASFHVRAAIDEYLRNHNYAERGLHRAPKGLPVTGV